MPNMTVVRVGGISLVAGALAFVGVFTYLAMQFDYPAILDGSAAEVLPKLLATGSTGRLVWALYGFLPLIFVPAGKLCFSLFFLLSALAMLASAGRFPRWIGYLGVFTAVAGLVGMFRNVSDLVSPVAALNNYLLPLWMIIFGVALLRDARRMVAADNVADSFGPPAPQS